MAAVVAPGGVAAYAPAAVAPGLPAIMPEPATRHEQVLEDGSRAVFLLSNDNRACFKMVRTLCNALMGKVKSAAMCSLDPATNRWTIPDRPPMVAIKQLYKVCVERGVTLEGKPVKENPLLEVSTLAHLNDPGSDHVMKLLHFLEDDECFFIVYELLDDELFNVVHATPGRRVPEAVARTYFWQAALGLHYCHTRGIVHRDISLENLMLLKAWPLAPHPASPPAAPAPTGDAAAGGATAPGTAAPGGAAAAAAPVLFPAGTVKIIDFGLAQVLPGSTLMDLLPDDDKGVGKTRYMAPETYALHPYREKIDVWCLGMSLFVFLFGIYPYTLPSASRCKYFKEIAEGRLLTMLTSWKYHELVSPAVLDLLDHMIRVPVASRYTALQVLAHPWFDPERAADPVGAAAVAAAVQAAAEAEEEAARERRRRAEALAAASSPLGTGAATAGSPFGGGGGVSFGGIMMARGGSFGADDGGDASGYGGIAVASAGAAAIGGVASATAFTTATAGGRGMAVEAEADDDASGDAHHHHHHHDHHSHHAGHVHHHHGGGPSGGSPAMHAAAAYSAAAAAAGGDDDGMGRTSGGHAAAAVGGRHHQHHHHAHDGAGGGGVTTRARAAAAAAGGGGGGGGGGAGGGSR